MFDNNVFHLLFMSPTLQKISRAPTRCYHFCERPAPAMLVFGLSRCVFRYNMSKRGVKFVFIEVACKLPPHPKLPGDWCFQVVNIPLTWQMLRTVLRVRLSSETKQARTDWLSHTRLVMFGDAWLCHDASAQDSVPTATNAKPAICFVQ